MKPRKIALGFVIKRVLISVALILGVLTIWIWIATFHPAQVQAEPIVCPDHAPALRPGQSLKVLTYNVRYMIGIRYVPIETSRNESPRPENIAIPIEEVARIIRDEDPDIVLLQEVSHGSSGNNYQDQLADLLFALPPEYACHTSALFQQIGFIPPDFMRTEGWKISTVSKYQISEATRHQLALNPSDDFITRQLRAKRAVLEVRLPVEGGKDLVALNTHLSPIVAQGTGLMQKQVAQVDFLLDNLTRAGTPWIMGGDFNLLPPGQYSQLQAAEKIYYEPETELRVLLDRYQAVPSLANVRSSESQRWFTYFPDDARSIGPDRTIDYLFFSDHLQLTDSYVRQQDTLAISDHLPVIAQFQLP